MSTYEAMSELESALFALDNLAATQVALMGMNTNTPQPVLDAISASLGCGDRLGMEGIGSFLMSIYDGLINLIQTIAGKIKDVFDAIFSSGARTERKVEAVSEKTKKKAQDSRQSQVKVTNKTANAVATVTARQETQAKIQAVTDTYAEAADNGDFDAALEILMKLQDGEEADVEKALAEAEKLIGEPSKKLAEKMELDKAPNFKVFEDSKGNKVERKIISIINGKMYYVDVTLDSRKNPVKLLPGNMVIDERTARHYENLVKTTMEGDALIPVDQVARVSEELLNITRGVTAQRNQNDSKKSRTGKAVQKLIKSLKRARNSVEGSINAHAKSDGNETNLKVTESQAKRISELTMQINTLITKPEYQDAVLEMDIIRDLNAAADELDNLKL